jgi:hypothetical protein
MPPQPFTRIFEQFLPAFLPQVAHRPLAHAFGAAGVDALYESVVQSPPVADAVLAQLNVSYQVAEQDAAQIPATGSAVVLANHPHGFLDAAVLASLCLSIRSDVKFLANPALGEVDRLRELIIPVDPDRLATHGNGTGVRKALQFLNDGGLLVIFPAGEVSHFDRRSKTVCDADWQEPVARILRLALRRAPDLRVIPAFIEGRNSLLFQAAGMVHPARVRRPLRPLRPGSRGVSTLAHRSTGNEIAFQATHEPAVAPCEASRERNCFPFAGFRISPRDRGAGSPG